ncbi:MAG: GNAT family N-acetyltransferase, partial [Xanthobacteraceae bacterium]
MHEVLPESGVIRKLWIGETTKYREHVLRLDPESRHNRFAGGVSDDFIRNYVELTAGLDTVVHGFFVDGMI